MSAPTTSGSSPNYSSDYKKSRTNNKSYANEKIDITREEFDRLTDALKKEEFRKLFLDYCEEIQDPENRKIYESEITQLEAERGVEVTFINPEPGFVVKTSVDGDLKCFINIAQNAKIAKPTSAGCLNQETGERGLNWSIPMAQTAPRNDLDNQGKYCRVFDVIFNPDALYLGHRNKTFHKLLVDTALDAVEREYEVCLDRTNLKFPKINYKGLARATVIRKLIKNPPSSEATEPHPLEESFPAKPAADSLQPKVIPVKKNFKENPEYNNPKYTIKYQRDVDLSEHTYELDAKLNMTMPRKLVVEIELPLLKSTAECQLDVTEKSIYLVSERVGARYRLKLDLPYIVNDKEGNARFDTDIRQLCITLPVVQQSVDDQRNMHNTLLHLNREDSGVESDTREDINSNESLVEELNISMEDHGLDANEGDDDEAIPYEITSSIESVADEKFLKATIEYKFPEKFDCNIYDNFISLVLHVRNVQPESISKKFLSQNLHFQFTSLGAGYYPTYYAFYMQLPMENAIEIKDIEIEPWENNVVVNINFTTTEMLPQKYFAGLDIYDLKEYTLPKNSEKSVRKRMKSPPPVLRDISPDTETNSDTPITDQTTEDEQTINLSSDSTASTSSSNSNNDIAFTNTTEDEDGQTAQKKSNKRRRRNKKRRSYSESDSDILKDIQKQQQQVKQIEQQTQKESEKVINNNDNIADDNNKTAITSVVAVSASVEVPKSTNMQRKQRSYSECSSIESSNISTPLRSILKPFSRYAPRSLISDSCSSDDLSPTSQNFAFSYQFSQSFDDIPEENITDGLSESCKKTVRFNDNIQKQVFRLDSSILGQRKKNQKRRDRKQRALQRRLSEGDSVDYANNKETSLHDDNLNYFKKNFNNNEHLQQNDVNNLKNLEQLQKNGDNDDVNANNSDNKKTKRSIYQKSDKHLSTESSIERNSVKNPMIFDMEI